MACLRTSSTPSHLPNVRRLRFVQLVECNGEVNGGALCFRGTRIKVAQLLHCVAGGTDGELLNSLKTRLNCVGDDLRNAAFMALVKEARVWEE